MISKHPFFDLCKLGISNTIFGHLVYLEKNLLFCSVSFRRVGDGTYKNESLCRTERVKAGTYLMSEIFLLPNLGVEN